ncbi:F0F1 ATP synthase subunit B [Staphylospora marina]|uniref:F0F1 ATP synthase subunit B n=1 Tax=Staphylospora marina TaxID=2490858 RepID=UPI000F5C0F5D|nr:F0F1 ATP synthase subunit B [Staphylospora marina]
MNLELGTMLFQLVAFLILMLLVSRFALRPMLNVMQKRQDYIEEQIRGAEKNRKEAEELLEKQREELNKARVEAREIIDRAKAQSEREAEEILKKAQERAERMIEEATIEIRREKEKALADLREEVAGLAVGVASKLLEKELDAKGQSRLVNSYLEQVGRLQ